MPAYDYRCQACGNRFDVWQKITDDPIQVCPKCSGHVQRIIHATGIVFKGAGFYSTDQRGATTAALPADDAAPVAADGKADAKAAKTETAPTKGEAKGETKPSAPASTSASA